MTCINFMTGFEMLGDPAKYWTSVVIFAIENPLDLSCCDSGIGSEKTSYRRLIHDPKCRSFWKLLAAKRRRPCDFVDMTGELKELWKLFM